MVTQLDITNFKNYSSLRVAFGEHLNFIVGLNGVGKTNLLDAIHYMGVTRSFTTVQDKYNVLFGQDFFRVEAHIVRNDKIHKLCAKVRPGSLKEMLLDGQKIGRLGDHIGFLPVIILSPRDHVLITGASADRRRFLDFYLCQIDKNYLDELVVYNRLLAQRNALLKEQGWRADEQLLTAYTTRMEGPAARIATLRHTFLAQLQPLVEKHYRVISAQPVPVHLAYETRCREQALSQLAADALEKDKSLGRTTQGVHRDDITLDLSELPVKRFGSQGQMKSYLIALHLAVCDDLRARKGLAPLLLLDDIFDKLDDERVRHLVEVLGDHDFGQVFITDARPERIRAVCAGMSHGARILHIRATGDVEIEDYPHNLANLDSVNSIGVDQEE